jgi:hypothetical protein
MQTNRDKAFWQRLIRAYERSGLEQRIFCERHGVELGRFKYHLYKSKQRRNEKVATRTSSALVRVETPKPASPAHGSGTNGLGGVVLCFAGADPRYIAAVLSEVGNARC